MLRNMVAIFFFEKRFSYVLFTQYFDYQKNLCFSIIIARKLITEKLICKSMAGLVYKAYLIINITLIQIVIILEILIDIK